MTPLEKARLFVDRVKTVALVTGIVGVAGCGFAFMRNPEAFFQAYIVAFIFWGMIALGCLALVMLHNLTGGEWGGVSRPIFIAGARTLWTLPLAFVPILFGLKMLFPWADPAMVQASHVLEHRAPFMNVPFFVVRAVIYFAIWGFFAWWTERWVKRVELDGHEEDRRAMQRRSALGVLLYMFTVSLASVDWAMSLDPIFTSTIYGMWFVVASGIGAFALDIVVLAVFSELEQFRDVVKPHNFHDLGTLLFAFIMLWAYFSFSQYLIIWNGNLEEEIPWYIARNHGIWRFFTIALMVGHFALPFFILLSRTVKRNRHWLAPIALFILVLRYLDFTWLLKPSMKGTVVPLSVADFATMLALGGFFIWMLFKQLPKTRAYLPRETVSDEQYEEEVYGGVV